MRGAALGLAAIVALGACAGGDSDKAATGTGGPDTTAAAGPGQSTAQTPDPCTLVTVEEVSAALGSPLDPPESSTLTPPIGGRTCLFVNSDAPPVKTFQIVVRTDGDFAENLRGQGQTVARLYEDTKRLSSENGTTVEDVTGLGDRAYKTPRGYYILKGGVSLETNLGLNFDPSPEAIAALQDLTEKAASRL